MVCPTRQSSPLSMYGLMNALKYGIPSNIRRITDTLYKFIYVWFHDKWNGRKNLFMQLDALKTEWCINVILHMIHHQKWHKKLFRNAFWIEKRPNTKQVTTLVIFSTIIKLHVESWRQGFYNMDSKGGSYNKDIQTSLPSSTAS